MKDVHPVCRAMRELRTAAGWSLGQTQIRSGINALALGSYERGDRIPPLTKADQVLHVFGHTLIPVPTGMHAVRRPGDIAAELRAIADHIDGTVRGT